MFLSDAEIGNVYIIKKINCTGNLKRRMFDLGLIEGSPIKPLFRSPAGDPTAYQICGAVMALRREISSEIEVVEVGALDDPH